MFNGTHSHSVAPLSSISGLSCHTHNILHRRSDVLVCGLERTSRHSFKTPSLTTTFLPPFSSTTRLILRLRFGLEGTQAEYDPPWETLESVTGVLVSPFWSAGEANSGTPPPFLAHSILQTLDTSDVCASPRRMHARSFASHPSLSKVATGGFSSSIWRPPTPSLLPSCLLPSRLCSAPRHLSSLLLH